MILMIDDNVLLDVLMKREPFCEKSVLVWKLCETDRAEGVITTHTIANIVYVMRKQLEPGTILQLVKKIERIFVIEDIRKADIMNAAKLEWHDFEDAVRSVVSTRINADWIVTRNRKDYNNSKVPAVLPSELINRVLLS